MIQTNRNPTHTMSNPHRLHSAIAGLLALLAVAIGTAAEPLPGFKLEGSKWTYNDGQLSMEGILIKPDGNGPFPAILISHGMGGNAAGFGAMKAAEFVKWGFVCIAPNYTHAGPVVGRGPRGASAAQSQKKSGDRQKAVAASGKAQDASGNNPAGPGASDENLRRASKCLDVLASLSYVDSKRLAAYGNSMGAFITAALSAKEAGRLKATAITAGGIWSRAGTAAEEQVNAARVPMCILHGGSDTTVPPDSSARLKAVLDRNQVPNERHVFEGVGHNLHQQKADEVYPLMRAWFTKLGVLEK